MRFVAARLALVVFYLPAVVAAQSSDSAVPVLDAVQVRARPAAERLSLDAANQTGSRLGLTPRETPASVTVIDRDRLDAIGALTTQDALVAAPGVTFAAPPGSAGSVSYRGFTGGQITQLFNGITVQYDPIAARPVDGWTLDRVEVIGGPSTFLYGAGAVGGAINYVTKLATRDADFSQVRLIAGSWDTTQVALGLNRRFGAEDGVRNAVRFDVNRAHSNGWVDGEQRTAWTAAASLLTDMTARVSHTLAVEWQDEQVERPYWGTPLLNPTAGGDGRIRPDTRFANYNARDGIYAQNVIWARSLLEWRPTDAITLRNTLYHYAALRDFANVEVYRFNPANTLVNRTAALLQRHEQELTGNRVDATLDGTLFGLRSDWAAGLDFSV
nr:TonB-dependent receptor plug domain-containing protein [Burkholderiales bacterium]